MPSTTLEATSGYNEGVYGPSYDFIVDTSEYTPIPLLKSSEADGIIIVYGPTSDFVFTMNSEMALYNRGIRQYSMRYWVPPSAEVTRSFGMDYSIVQATFASYTYTAGYLLQTGALLEKTRMFYHQYRSANMANVSFQYTARFSSSFFSAATSSFNTYLGYSVSMLGTATNTYFTLRYDLRLLGITTNKIFVSKYALGRSAEASKMFYLKSKMSFQDAVDQALPDGIREGDYVFDIGYKSTLLERTHRKEFALYSRLGLLDSPKQVLRMSYDNDTVEYTGDRTFTLFNYSSPTREYSYNFSSRYKIVKYLPVTHEFDTGYHIRLNSTVDQSIASRTFETVDGLDQFTLTLSDVNVNIGTYVLVVNNGSKYNSYFRNIALPVLPLLDESIVIMTDFYMDISITQVIVDALPVYVMTSVVRDVDITAPVSLSLTSTESLLDSTRIFSSNWPSWSSYIDVESRLTELRSEGFKIFPLQPSTCCILETTKACTLPDYVEVDDVVIDSDVIPLNWESVSATVWDMQEMSNSCGVDLANIGNAVDLDLSVIKADVIGPGVLKFDWGIKTSGVDSMWFKVSDAVEISISGETDVSTVEVIIPRGAITLEWYYLRNNSTRQAGDMGTVDAVIYRED